VEQLAENVLRHSRYDVEVSISNISASKLIHDRFIVPSYSEQQLISIRVTKNKRSGFSICNDLNQWKQCLRNAERLMLASKEYDLKPELPDKQRYPRITYSKALASMSFEKLYNDFISAIKLKTRVTNAMILKTVSNTLFMNSNGIKANDRDSELSFSVETKKGNATSFNIKSSRVPFDLNVAAEEAERYCIKSIKPKPIRSMVTDVLLDYFALSSLINMLLIPAFYANRVQKRESFLTEKLGEQIFSEALTINDNGTNGLMASPFDAEGVRCQDKVLVDNGVVKSFLYDSYSSQKDKTVSTGNCISLSQRPSIGPTNFIVKPGKAGFNQNDCLYIRSVAGVHTSNPVSGDFSVNIDNAFYKGVPVKHAMIAGNIVDLFKNIVAIGKNPRQEDNVCTPALLFSDVKVIA